MGHDFVYLKTGNIFYQIEGNGETIVFLHGFSLDHSMWKNQINYFSKKYQVLAYDQRGFGNSTDPIDPYSHYQDLENLLIKLKIAKVHLVGLSLGGINALDFTVEFPKYVKSLTVVDSALSGYTSNVDWKKLVCLLK